MMFLALLLLFGIIIVGFPDVLAMVLLRLAAFGMFLWIAFVTHTSLTFLFLGIGMPPAFAQGLAFGMILITCCAILRWTTCWAPIAVRGKLKAVGADLLRVSLIVALLGDLLVTLAVVLSGRPLSFSWSLFSTVSCLSVVIDVSAPDLLARVARELD